MKSAAASPPVDVKRVFSGLASVCGVDFSGAAQSGKTAWLAELEVQNGEVRPAPAPLRLVALRPIGRLAGSDRREDVCGYLVDRILHSRQTLWGCDFPFGLPVELRLGDWPRQLARLRRFDSTAADYGRNLVERTQARTGVMHVRRRTDRETSTPFDCYHYRIIYQTFHGMRDVLGPLEDDAKTAVLPFQYRKVELAERVVVEACPSSTLKRLELPHRLYKQTGGRVPTSEHKQMRRQILRGIRSLVQISDYRRRVILNNSGGDALDAVLAALGSWQGCLRGDHQAIAADRRYPREGFVFC